MSRKRIFISGPYSADLKYKIWDNIAAAEKVGRRLAKAGYDVIIPHSMYQSFDDADYDMILAMCIRMIESGFIDIVYVLKGYETSSGSLKEIATAQACDVEVLYEEA